MPSVLALSAKGASFLIFIQICSKSLTFVINQLLLRHLSPETLGVSTQLELFAITVLYFSRESFRVVLQRPTSSTQVAVNVAYIPFMIGIPISLALGFFNTRSDSLSAVPSIRLAFTLSGLSALIKLAYEPCFAVVQQHLLYSIRARCEATAAIARCIVTYLAVVWFKKNYGDVGGLPFAIGLVAGAVVLFTSYYVHMIPVARQKNFSLLPKKITRGPAPKSEYIASYFSRSLCSLGLNIYLQSSVKYILTQGDALLITWLATLHDQGAYALASNYGGLIARVVFQPIEESSRNLFAKLCLPSETPPLAAEPDSGASEAHATDSKSTNGQANKGKHADTSTVSEETTSNATNPSQAAQILTHFLHLYSLLSLVSVSVGPPLAPLLLSVLAGKKWTATNAPQVLATYTYYIPFLAINGVTEAFVAAVATNADLRRQSFFLFANFLCFALTAWICVAKADMGAEGLVWACCVGLAGRCIWNGKFIRQFFADRGVYLRARDMMPALPCVATAIAITAVVRSAKFTPRLLADETMDRMLGIGGLAALMGISILSFERNFLWSCYRMVVPKPTPPAEAR